MSKSATAKRRKASAAPAKPAPPAWLRHTTLALAALCLLGLFSTEIADTDFWWHLKTGQYIVQRHSLPVPDPFAYTTALNPPSDAREAMVRHFNLTHEWLSQAMMYLVYATGGFPAIVLVRSALLAALCGLAGFLAWRLGADFWTGIAAAFATASVAIEFRADRPAVVTFLCVAIFVIALELRRGLWALPVIALLWANAHGGFVLGWIVLGAYCIGSIRERRLWLVAGCCVAASLLNPNTYHVTSVMLGYRSSPMTASLIEWQPPSLWGPPYGYDVLLYATALVLIASWRKVSMAHWILFVAFAAASLAAFRNTILIGFLAPALIALYFPRRIRIPRGVSWAFAPVLAAALLAGIVGGAFFQLHNADWTIPTSAAGFILENHITGPMFNTYEQGGYLIWKLWPQQRVFMDGRDLSEAAYRDYRQILFNRSAAADQLVGPRAGLFRRYGVQLVTMNTIDYVSGALYPLALALANPATQDWQLVYEDTQEVVFMREPPPGMPVVPNKFGAVLKHLDAECAAYIEHSPGTPLCARTMADFWMRNGQVERARRMLNLYLSHAAKRDEQAERLRRQLGGL
jgi:hypothetical protein